MTTDSLYPDPVAAEIAALHMEAEGADDAEDGTPWIVDDAPVWNVEVVFSEEGAETRADAFLVVHAMHLRATGTVLSGPGGHGPRIAEERAAAKVLADLSQQLVEAADAATSVA